MSSPDLQSHVAAHPFFAGLNERQTAILADCAELASFERDQMLFKAGDPAKGFYLIESGSIAVEGGEEGHLVTIDTVRAGEPLGWSWIFEPYVCEYGARAIEPTTALFIDAVRLAEHRGGDLTLGHELFKRMSGVMVRRLNAARKKLVLAASGSGS
ncbi:MAG: cyclic nucleotide-binding domain-containing protein [Verrucomicrobiota bacterium]|nr:cyclic nucleotide-binding domain-containing protein [Verrucomicrobiota bacterium]